MDGHFSEKMNINNCKQRSFLANLEIFRHLCTHNCRKTPCMLLKLPYGGKIRPRKKFGLPLFKSWLCEYLLNHVWCSFMWNICIVSILLSLKVITVIKVMSLCSVCKVHVEEK